MSEQETTTIVAEVTAPPPAPVEEPAPEIKIGTVQPSKHFPNCNQTKFCYTQYTAFWRCVADHDGDEAASACADFKKAYTSICPDSWKEAWDEQREAGTFPTPYRSSTPHH